MTLSEQLSGLPNNYSLDINRVDSVDDIFVGKVSLTLYPHISNEVKTVTTVFSSNIDNEHLKVAQNEAIEECLTKLGY